MADHPPAEYGSMLSVVIPALNEAEGIRDTLARARAACEGLMHASYPISAYELIVVDDGSTDRTGEIAGTYPGVRVIRHGANRGYGAALQSGFASARGDLLAFLDADGTYPAEALPDLCRALVELSADMVVGSRLARDHTGMPLVRVVGNAVYARLVSALTGAPVTDAASGMRVLRADAYGDLLPLPEGLDFTPAMTTRALSEGLVVREVPISYAERIGRSKLSVIRDGWRFFKTILRIAHTYDPFRLYALAGLLFLVCALLLGIGPVVYYVQHRLVEDWEIYRLLTIVVLAVTGVNLITFGIFTRSVAALVYRSWRRPERPLSNDRAVRWVVRNAAILGPLLMAAAAILNYDALGQYVLTGRIATHWSYILTGMFLFLIGSELVMLAGLVRTLETAARQFRPAADVPGPAAPRGPRRPRRDGVS